MPSAATSAVPSFVGVECNHTATCDPGNIPVPSTRKVLPRVNATDPFASSGSNAPVSPTDATIIVDSPIAACTCCFSICVITTCAD